MGRVGGWGIHRIVNKEMRLHSEMALLDLNEESDGVLLCHCNVEVEESGDYVKHTVTSRIVVSGVFVLSSSLGVRWVWVGDNW